MNGRRLVSVAIIIMVSIIGTAATLSIVSAAVEYETFSSDAGTYSGGQNTSWVISGSVGTDNAPTANPGALLFTTPDGSFPAHAIGDSQTVASGRYIIEFDWYYTGDVVTVTMGSHTGATSCSSGGVDWVTDTWNSCSSVIQVANTIGSVWFLAESGSLDMVSDLVYLSTIPAPTPTPDPNATPTATPPPQPPSCGYSLPDSLSWVFTIEQGINNTVFENDGEGGFSSTGHVSRRTDTGGVAFKFDPVLSLPDGVSVDAWYLHYRETGVSDIPINDDSYHLYHTASFDLSVMDGRPVDNVYPDNYPHWRFAWAGYLMAAKKTNFVIDEVELYLSDGSVCITDAPIEPPPPSEYDLSCDVPVISGTQTLTDTLPANLLINGSFEDGLTGWFTGTGDYGVIQTYPTDNWASDGSHVLSMPGGISSILCQEFTVPDENIVYLTGGMDLRAAGDGTGSRNVNLRFTPSITYQLAVGFLQPEDTNTWTVVAGGQNLLGGSTGSVCLVSDYGDVSAYVDRVYVYGSDSLSNTVCVQPTDPITTTPTPTPTPLPSPTPVPTPPPPDNYPTPPIGDGGGACYNCLIPTNMLNFGQWFRWLLCGINNLFYCYLYVWLLSIGGYLAAVWQLLAAATGWVVASLQAIITWIGGSIVAVVLWFRGAILTVAAWGQSVAYWLYSLGAAFTTDLYNNIMGLLATVWGVVGSGWALIKFYAAAWWGLMQLYWQMIGTLFAAVLGLFEMAWGMATSAIGAFTVDGYTTTEIFGYNLLELSQPTGINDASLFYWLVMGFMLADSFIAISPYMAVMMYTVMGLMSYGVITWSLKKFTTFLPVS